MTQFSWTKTDLSNLKTLEKFPNFFLVKWLHAALLSFFLILINLDTNLEKYNLFPKTNFTQLMRAYPLSQELKWGMIVSALLSFFITGLLAQEASRHGEKQIPEGLEYIIAAGYGLVGLVLMTTVLLLVPNLHSLANAFSFIMLFSAVCYAMMRTAILLLNRFALGHFVILYLSVNHLPLALESFLNLSPNKISWIQTYVPLVILLIYPLVINILPKPRLKTD